MIEPGLAMLVPGRWKLLYGLLAVAFTASGIVSFIFVCRVRELQHA